MTPGEGMLHRSAPLLVCALALSWSALVAGSEGSRLEDDLRTRGVDPKAFVFDQLRRHDLIVFDDGLHTLVEPFEFYRDLVRDPAFPTLARYVFLETVPLNQQRHLEAYLTAARPDPALLLPAFQNDLGGEGLPYTTYFRLLETIREVNATLPDSLKIQVVAVGSPTYWSEIRTPRDVEVFRQGLAAYDYTMYAMIRETLDGTGGRGIFLTNTRHAYQAIRRADGSLYWNATTYFHERNPGRAFSIRFHAPQLFIERVRAESSEPRTTQGLERVEYRFGRMENGAWDRAFADHGNLPVAVALRGSAFGEAPYVGNLMLDLAPGQTMADAYDAVIFLAPLEALRQTAKTADLYTPAFRSELARRLTILHPSEELARMIADAGATDLDAYIRVTYVAEPEKPLPQSRALPPLSH